MLIDYTRAQLKHWVWLFLSFFTLFYAYHLKGSIRYGMDLQGGVSLTFMPKEQEITKYINTNLQDEIKQYLSDKRIIAIVKSTPAGVLISTNQKFYIKNSNWIITDTENGLLVNYSPEAIDIQKKNIFEKIYSVIRVRADEQSTSGISVYQSGGNNIVVEMPGAKNPDELKRRLGSTGKLTFKLEGADGFVDGGSVNKANVSFDQLGLPLIHLHLNRKGAKDMQKLTESNVGKLMKISISGQHGEREIFSATVQSVLSSDIQITGIRSGEEAHEIALLIKSGALPVPLEIIEERTVGAELGSDVAYSGILACLMSIALVVGIMLAIYGVMGLIAGIALVINIAAVMIFVALTEYNLTLAGIAGLALSAGMAVDANVLINESMRKSLQEGKSWSVTLVDGYANALRTIWDSNLTTLIAGLILYCAGTGIIRSFAVIFTVGLVISFFTSVVLTKMMMEVCVDGAFETPISRALSRVALPFRLTVCQLRKIASVISLMGISAVTISGLSNGIHWGVDFTGGVTLEIETTEDIASLRQEIGDLCAMQEIGKGAFLIKTESTANADAIMERLGSSAECRKRDMVGPKLGGDLLSTCVKAIFFALFCM